MKKYYVDFNYGWFGEHEPKHTIDLNDHQVKAHIKALVRGGGSTSETIVNGFVLDDPQKIVSAGFTNLEQAWQRLDDWQKEIIPHLRELACTSSVDMSNAPFSLYQRMVFNEFDERRDQYLEKMGEEYDSFDIPKDTLTLLASNAEKHIANILTRYDTQPVYQIKEQSEEY